MKENRIEQWNTQGETTDMVGQVTRANPNKLIKKVINLTPNTRK